MSRNIMKSLFSILLATSLVSCGLREKNSAFDSSNEINVVSRENGSGTRGAFVEMFGILEKTEDTESDNTTEEAMIVNKAGVVMTTVVQDKYAIGYISLGSINDTIKPIKINEVEATVDNILNGSYESARPFLVVTKDDSNELANDLISFILSAEGQAIIGESYVPVGDEPLEYVSSGHSGKLSIGGSTSVAPIMEKLVEAYKEKNPDVVIDIQETGSSAGISGAMEGSVDVGMSSRDLKEEEANVLTQTAIAYDGLVLVVNNKNPLENLTSEQVKNIFIGEYSTWNEVYE